MVIGIATVIAKSVQNPILFVRMNSLANYIIGMTDLMTSHNYTMNTFTTRNMYKKEAEE